MHTNYGVQPFPSRAIVAPKGPAISSRFRKTVALWSRADAKARRRRNRYAGRRGRIIAFA